MYVLRAPELDDGEDEFLFKLLTLLCTIVNPLISFTFLFSYMNFFS